ncbi:MAG: hypothetical protein K1000chlam3_01581 [Chlamydiae bacterium]|nr:hypothetical protein [Chlamydiota bacterium]
MSMEGFTVNLPGLNEEKEYNVFNCLSTCLSTFFRWHSNPALALVRTITEYATPIIEQAGENYVDSFRSPQEWQEKKLRQLRGTLNFEDKEISPVQKACEWVLDPQVFETALTVIATGTVAISKANSTGNVIASRGPSSLHYLTRPSMEG